MLLNHLYVKRFGGVKLFVFPVQSNKNQMKLIF